MKRTFLLTIAALILLPGCTPQDSIEAIKATLDGKTIATLTFSASNGDAKTINITSSMAWELTKKPSWLNVNPTSGEGSKKVTITVNQANSSTTKRDGELIFQSSKGSKLTIKVSQQGIAPPVVLTTNATQTVFADQTAGAAVKFTATGNWSAVLSLKTKAETPLDWISINPKSGGAGSHTLTVTLQPNYTGADRTAVITITSGTDKAEATVTQKGTTQDGKLLEKKYDIYIGGTIYESGENNLWGWHFERGCYVYLKNGNNSNWFPGRIIDIAVSGDDVHVIGYNRVSENGVTVQRVHYWKNGQEVSLPVTQRNNWVTGIKVIGSDVYISGYEEIPIPNTSPASSKFVAKYWKNGVVYTLGNAIDNSFLLVSKW